MQKADRPIWIVARIMGQGDACFQARWPLEAVVQAKRLTLLLVSKDGAQTRMVPYHGHEFGWHDEEVSIPRTAISTAAIALEKLSQPIQALWDKIEQAIVEPTPAEVNRLGKGGILPGPGNRSA